MMKHFGILCFEIYNDSLKVSLIERFICFGSEWRQVIENTLPNGGLLFTFGDKCFAKIINKKINPFWKEYIEIWDVFKSFFAITADNVRTQALSLSSFIKRGRKGIWCKKKLLESGCIYTGDLWLNTRQLMSYEEFAQANRAPVSMLEHMGIVRAVKSVIGGQITPREISPNMQPALEAILKQRTGCSTYYKTLLDLKLKFKKDIKINS